MVRIVILTEPFDNLIFNVEKSCQQMQIKGGKLSSKQSLSHLVSLGVEAGGGSTEAT